MGNFWKKLKKPVFILAPMSNVTDAAFRKSLLKIGRPDVFWTEFVSCEGLVSIGRKKLMRDLRFSKKEKPIVVQFFGSDPKKFYKCALLAQKMGFDGIDINMGCPDKAVVKQGAGAALILKPNLAKEIIRETKRGAGKLPVSVKTRIGYQKIQTEEWISEIIKAEPAAIIIHGRLKKDGYSGSADWQEIKKAVNLVKKISPDKRPIIIGNGDVSDLKDGKNKIKFSGVDGIMIGRAAFLNPWIFSEKNPDLKERKKALIGHLRFFDEIFKKEKPFETVKKFYKSYISGFDGAKELRIALMSAKNSNEAKIVLNDNLKKRRR